MANATLYTSQDPGGPGVFARGPVQSAFDILVPCLVTGYGNGSDAKPGQGWTIFHADLPTGFVLKAPDGVFYIFMMPVDTSKAYDYYQAQIWMAESISEPVTYPPVGTNVRSMNHSPDYSTDSDRHWFHFGNTNTYPAYWAIAARGSQVIFSFYTTANDSGYGSNMTATSNYGGSTFFGNLKLREPTAPVSGPQNSAFIGGAGEYPESQISSARYSFNIYGCYTYLRNPYTGIAETGSLASLVASPLPGATNNSYRINPADPVLSDIVLTQVQAWLSGTGAVGWIPGLFYMGYTSHYATAALMVRLGKSGSYSELRNPVSLAGEEFYIFPNSFGHWTVSLDEKYWQ